MGLFYEDLDTTTRGFMIQELNVGNPYQSPRLTERGLDLWPQLLSEACRYNDDIWLEEQLVLNELFKTHEFYIRNGIRYRRRINAKKSAQMLAEGEFNRYYLRGICLRAQHEGFEKLTVYRGKEVSTPRAESEAKIGTDIEANALLTTLRSHDFVSVDSAFSIPSGPNSGLTAKIKRSKTGLDQLVG